jgi:hypothetical protein
MRMNVGCKLNVNGQAARHGLDRGPQGLRQGVRVAPYGESEAQSARYAALVQGHLINCLSRAEGLTQEGVDMILDYSAYQIEARIGHNTIMSAKGAGL